MLINSSGYFLTHNQVVAGSSPAGPTLKHFHLEVLFYFKGVFQMSFAGDGASKLKGLPFIDSGSTIDLA